MLRNRSSELSSAVLAFEPPSWWTAGDVPKSARVTQTLREAFNWKTRSKAKATRQADLDKIALAYAHAEFCETCTTGRQMTYNHEVHPAELLRSALEGRCAGCLLLCGILNSYASAVADGSLSAWRLSSDEPLEVESYGASIIFRTGLTLNVFARQRCESPWSFPLLPKASNAPSNTGSDDTVSRTLSWLRDCTGGAHKFCKVSRAQLPTRVIQIFGPQSVRLHETKNEVADYFCLSHCWGNNDFIRTTTATVHRYLMGIEWNTLPRTFQDAISFTFRLGCQYLWIDSLCVIQDQIDDWRMEGSKMSEIYSNARLTIAATASSGAASGCFGSNSRFISTEYTYPAADGSPQNVCVRTKSSHSAWIYGRLPLLQRGWALQERLLSPRVAHFVEKEVIFECRTTTDCECATIGQDNHVQGISDFSRSLATEDGSSGQLWHSIVEDYARRRLSFEKDVFPALQGIAKQFHRQTKSIYLAGLWESNIINDLLWYCPDLSHVTRPQHWRAPSWSWASVVGPVTCISPESKMRALATYVDGTTTPIGADAFGEVSNGRIRLRGKYLSARFEASHGDSSHGKLIVKLGFHDDAKCHQGGIVWPDYDVLDSDIARPHSKALGLPSIPVRVLMIASDRTNHGNRGSLYYFLVLRAKHKEGELVHERVGLYYWRGQDWDRLKFPFEEEDIVTIV